jgi:hypothetical protein
MASLLFLLIQALRPSLQLVLQSLRLRALHPQMRQLSCCYRTLQWIQIQSMAPVLALQINL